MGPEPEQEDEPVDELLVGLEPEETYAPDKPKAPARKAAAATIPVKPPVLPQPGAPKKLPVQNMTKLIVLAVVALIVIAALVVVVLPMFRGAGSAATKGVASGSPAPSVTATPTASVAMVIVETATPTKPPATTATPVASSTPGPVQTLPSQYVLFFQVDKNTVTGDVTVSVTGPSRSVVNDIEVKLTRADGEIVTKHIIPDQKMTEVTLAGTRNSERVEITVLFYSGEKYKVFDKYAEFSRRM
jgi:hypothetical protein